MAGSQNVRNARIGYQQESPPDEGGDSFAFYTCCMSESRHHIRAYLIVLALLLLSVAIFGALSILVGSGEPDGVQDQTVHLPEGFPRTAPPPTANDIAVAQRGFQHLVAYTSAGFRPASFVMKSGEIVRFVNNTAAPAQISYAHAASPMLSPGQYWEHSAVATTTQFTYSAGGFSGTVRIE